MSFGLTDGNQNMSVRCRPFWDTDQKHFFLKSMGLPLLDMGRAMRYVRGKEVNHSIAIPEPAGRPLLPEGNQIRLAPEQEDIARAKLIYDFSEIAPTLPPAHFRRTKRLFHRNGFVWSISEAKEMPDTATPPHLEIVAKTPYLFG